MLGHASKKETGSRYLCKTKETAISAQRPEFANFSRTTTSSGLLVKNETVLFNPNVKIPSLLR